MKSISPEHRFQAPSLAAFFMIAFQMAGKAIRDATFLSHFPVNQLPLMFLAAALVALAGAFLFSVFLRRFGPSGLVPFCFLLSSILLAVEWTLLASRPALVAIFFYLHFAGLGSALISLFWSLVNETYDPHRAKSEVARIASAAAAGGFAGGLAVERLGALDSGGLGLLLLSLLHLASALATWRMPSPSGRRRHLQADSWTEGFQTARATPILRYAALLVCLNALAAGLIDYVFKSRAAESFSGSDLLRFFAFFYLATGLLTWLVQTLVGRYLLRRVDLPGALSQLSWGVLGGSLGCLLFPGFALPVLNRALEMVVRSSLYRSAYELLFTPISPQVKRSSKPVIDIGAERLGDAASGAVLQLMLSLAPLVAVQAALWLALAAAASGLLLIRRIAQAYVLALQQSLQERARELSLVSFRDSSSGRLLDSSEWQNLSVEMSISELATLSSATIDPARVLTTAESRTLAEPNPANPVEALRKELSSRDLIRVSRALRDPACETPELLPAMIPLLGWQEASRLARPVLRKLALRHTGQLLDALLDPRNDFQVRGNIPQILDSHPSDLAAHGLVIGLRDRRFSVRFQCSKILHRMSRKLEWQAPREQLLQKVMDELKVDPRTWKAHHLSSREMIGTVLLQGLRKPPSDAGLLHVFTLLSLIHPEHEMQLSFQALAADDDHLKGTAVEYLQSTLPQELLEGLLSQIGFQATPGPRKGRTEARSDLLKSQRIIVDRFFRKE